MFKPNGHTVERPNQSTWICEQNCEILSASKEYNRKSTSASRGTSPAHTTLLFVVFLVILAVGQCLEIAKCNFEDTADLSGAHRFENGSYLYENVIIPADQVAIYDYLEVANGERMVYPPHPRGCVCQEKKCVKFCCHPTKEILSSSGQCLALKQELHYNPEINVIFRNGLAAHQNVLKDFTVIHSQPCANAYPLFPEVSKDDEWDMFENGDMMLRHYRLSLTKRDYCLTPHQMSEDSWSLIAMNCPIPNTLSTTARVFNLGALMSAALMSLVVIIYLSIAELRNVLGTSIAACLLSMIAGNLILCTISLTEITFPQLMCSSMGYVTYFFYESAYIWMAIICYSLWQKKKQQTVFTVLDNDSTCTRSSERSNYLKNLMYALGIPFCFTAALMLIQGSNIDEAYKPGIGVEYCWLDVHIWPALPYFFGLNGLILVCGIIFLALSGESPEYDEYDDEKPIVQEKSDFYKPETQLPFIEDHKKMIQIVSQLFLIFAISWFLNVAAYLSEMLELESKPVMLSISDCMNFIEGPLVFYVLVLRPKVMSLLKRRSHPEAALRKK